MKLKIILVSLLVLGLTSFSFAADKIIKLNQQSGKIDRADYEYYRTVVTLIQKNWYAPKTDTKLSAIVDMKITESGQIVIEKIEKSSGNAEFDNSCIKAIEKASPLPAPSKEMYIGMTFGP